MQGGAHLYVQCENLHMSSEIHKKGITAPSSFDLDHVEGNVVQKVFQG